MTQIKSLKERILAHIVSEIPDELALCEFDCLKQDCTEDDWGHCEKRLQMVKAIRACRNEERRGSKKNHH